MPSHTISKESYYIPTDDLYRRLGIVQANVDSLDNRVDALEQQGGGGAAPVYIDLFQNSFVATGMGTPAVYKTLNLGGFNERYHSTPSILTGSNLTIPVSGMYNIFVSATFSLQGAPSGHEIECTVYRIQQTIGGILDPITLVSEQFTHTGVESVTSSASFLSFYEQGSQLEFSFAAYETGNNQDHVRAGTCYVRVAKVN